jgi:cytosine/adenosine deaminase-related metal-dependent hydrolase
MAGPPLEDGWLRVARGTIVALGRGRPPAGAIDLGAAIVLPGLVNAHTHLEFSDLRAPLDAAAGLPDWIGRIVRLRRERDAAPGAADQVAAALRSGLAESALAGVTTIGEIATQAGVAALTMNGPRLRTFREAIGLSAAAGEAAFRSLASDLDRLVAGAAAVTTWGRIDSVVPNAGIGLYGSILDWSDDEVAEMIARAAEAAKSTLPDCTVLGVTVLTSLDRADLEATGVSANPSDQVLRLAVLLVVW